MIILDKAKAIPGWMHDDELEWLANTARACHVIIEYGSYLGRSTRALADNCRGSVFAVDPWDGNYVTDDGSKFHSFSPADYDTFCNNLKDLIDSRKVIPIRKRSHEFVPPILADLIFIDGDHRYKECLLDIELAFNYIRNGGIIAGHDYGRPDWPGVKKAVSEVFSPQQVNIINTIWWVQV